MKYRIRYKALMEKVDQLVSQHAYRQYGEDGTPLYDNLIVPSNERHIVKAFIDAGVTALLRRLGDVAYIDPENSSVIVFNVPDFNETFSAAVRSALGQYLANYACACWMDRVAKDSAQLFLDITASAIDNAVKLLKTRKTPKRAPVTEETAEDDSDVEAEDGDDDDDNLTLQEDTEDEDEDND